MKNEYRLACIFCFVLIIISLFHLHHYSSCRNQTLDAVSFLKSTERSNQQLRNSIDDRVNRYNALREVAAHTAAHEQDKLTELQKIHANSQDVLDTVHRAKQVAPIIRQKEDEERERRLRIAVLREQEAKQRAKMLPPPLPRFGEQDYLLIEPNE